MDVDEDSDQNVDVKLCWMRQHGCLFEAFAHMR